MSEALVVLSSIGGMGDAERVARSLVERRVAACVSIVPKVTSVYRWKGAVERDAEHLLVIKTRADGFEALREALVALHPYDVPELLALPVAAGHEPYLKWLEESAAGGWKDRPRRPSRRRRDRRRGRPRPRSPR